MSKYPKRKSGSEFVRWGILGASRFSLDKMGPAIQKARNSQLCGVASLSHERAGSFLDFSPNVQLYDSYDELLSDPNIDAVYIPLPNNMHVEWALKSLEAGKHVLIEKPVAMNAVELDRLIEARDRFGKFAAEAFMIAHHPQWLRVRELISGGSIGQLNHVDSVFSYVNTDLSDIRNRSATGGGCIRDIGIYTFGSVNLVTNSMPQKCTRSLLKMENEVETHASISFDFADFSFDSRTSLRLSSRQSVTFHGDRGYITLTCPFNANDFDQAELHLIGSGSAKTIERFTGFDQYLAQVESFCQKVLNGTSYAWSLEQAKQIL